jgi:hypothetical protein
MDTGAIERVRNTSNVALAARDLVALSRCWAPDYMVITSVNLRAVGRTVNVDRLAMELLAKPDLELFRQPHTIRVFEAWGMAHEEGQWRAAWSAPDGAVAIAGTYSAKWQKYEDVGWLIEAELFVPSHCTGEPYCQRALPQAKSSKPDDVPRGDPQG